MPRVNSLDPTYDKFDKMVYFIRKKMREQKILQRDMAKELGMSPPNLTRLFATRHIKGTDLMKIFKIIEATPVEIGEWMT